jgi:hypothetical protein
MALYHTLAGTHRVKAATGCGIIAAAIPVIAMLALSSSAELTLWQHVFLTLAQNLVARSEP